MRTCLKAAVALVLAFIWGSDPAHAGRVQISLLKDDAVIEETLRMFRGAGCPQENLSSFNKAVREYNSTATAPVLPHLSTSRKGFDDFRSISDLLAALPFRLCDAPHEFQLNCFDCTFLLAGWEFQTKLAIDRAAGPFLVNCLMTNGQVSVRSTVTPREALLCSYGQWYLEKTAHLFEPQMLEHRACVAACMVGLTPLPATTSQPDLTEAVRRSLRLRWRNGGVKFPQHMEIVLGHLVSLPGHMVLTDHAGVILRTGKTFTYVEKAGGKGPFVRMDFDDESDLLTWLASYMKGAERVGYTDFFATFNDAEIHRLPVVTGRQNEPAGPASSGKRN